LQKVKEVQVVLLFLLWFLNQGGDGVGQVCHLSLLDQSDVVERPNGHLLIVLTDKDHLRLEPVEDNASRVPELQGLKRLIQVVGHFAEAVAFILIPLAPVPVDSLVLVPNQVIQAFLSSAHHNAVA